MAFVQRKTNSMPAILNHPPARAAGPQLLHQLVGHSVDGGIVAVDHLSSDGSRASLSYEEFHRRSDSLAAAISNIANIPSEGGSFVVPVLVSQGPMLYVTLLAILKAGGAFCPLNLDAPGERVRFILDDVSAKVIICSSDLASRVPRDTSPAVHVLILDDFNFGHASSGNVFLGSTVKPSDLAYVMYTSGSTGTPKGVGVSHDAATQSLLAHDRHIPAFSRFLQFAAPTFDVSVFEIFFPLFRGSTLVSCDRGEMLNDLPAVIRSMEVDACELTPTVAGNLLRKRQNAPGLRLLLTIGEMLTGPVVEEFGGNERHASILWAMYGPTEAAIHCTLQPAFSSSSAVGNIGVPLDTVSAFVLRINEAGQRGRVPEVLATGEVGELAIGGFQLASGYLNRPEQTTAAFIDSPYGPLYRTGDKARMLENGTIECLGRISEGQVKLRGQRIELGEVEQAAMRTPACRGAVAAVVGNVLVLFCSTDAIDGIDADIRKTCGTWLPAFMIPGDIVVMGELPRLSSGKVDRKGLVSSYRDTIDHPPEKSTAFKDDLERRLCEAACAVLKSRVDPSTNLSAAGLDSLVAIKFTSSLRQSGWDVSAADVLGYRTISQLHAAISHRWSDTLARGSVYEQQHVSIAVDDTLLREVSVLEGLLGDIESVVPCTALQESMLAETLSDSGSYCNWIEISFPGDFPEETIITWFHQLAEGNEILRSGFCHFGTGFAQVVWNRLDASQAVTVGVLAREYRIASESDLLRPFQIQVAPSGSDERRVLLQIHHALYDGWTMDMLLEDLNRLSRSESVSTRPQFTDVVAYTRSSDYHEKCNAARAFWADDLCGYQPRPFPGLTDTDRISRQTASTEVTFDIDPDQVAAAIRPLGCGPQALFQAALIFVWSLMVGSEDVVIGTVTSGRALPISRIEDIMGPCIASVPLRANTSQAKSVKDLLATVHAASRSSLRHSVLPLSELLKACGALPGQPIYDVLFVYQESLASRDLRQQTIRQVDHQDRLETKVVVELEPRDASLSCRITHHLDVLPERHAKIFVEQLRCVARHFLTHLDGELSSARSAFPTELLSTHNTEPRTLSGIPDLARTVERVAHDHPDRAAVCFAHAITEASADTETISFRQLNGLGNQIASLLRDRGVHPGQPVAIVLEKSVLLYAGILGIVKAGCSYLPLLPTTPASRLDTILAHAGVRVCLADTASHGQLQHLVASPGLLTINLEEKAFDIYSDSTAPEVPADPTRVANIIYTSGSTGVPKGVCVTQLNITSNLDVLSRIYPVSNHSRLLQSCSQAFDVSVFEIFFAWTRGMCLCSATNDTLFEDLERSIRELGVTHLSMTPTVASLIDPARVPAVEFLVTSGEPMTEAVAQRWWRQLYQGYGPSETTNICTVKKMHRDSAIRHLGWAFENTSAFVLYQDSEEAVPLGCVGELCFGGDQVAQGYLGMAQLTSSKFVHHPQHGRLYRSGDLGRMLSDGSLVITGRADDQVKLRGQRIELGEIGSAMKELAEVADCVTLLVAKRYGGSTTEQIASFYLVGSDGGDGQGGEARDASRRPETIEFDEKLTAVNARLFRHLSSRLPVYMVPSYLVPISRVPLTAAGKLDKVWLRRVFSELKPSYLESAAAPPPGMAMADNGEADDWTDVERGVASEITSSLSHLLPDTIQRWTPLTAVGIDSLSAIGLARRLQKRFGRRVPISTILRNLCVARLATALEKLPTADQPGAGVGNTVDSLSFLLASDEAEIRSKLRDAGKVVEQILPCTPLQESMLAASTHGRRSYLNRLLFRLNASPEIIRQAWEQMFSRHSILRTCFVSTQNAQHAIAQVVLDDSWRPRWYHMDDGAEDDGGVDRSASHHEEMVSAAVDSFEPPFSLATITNGKTDNNTYLSFICHHALYDAVGIERLLVEVEEVVRGLPLPQAPSFAPFLREALSPSPTREAFWTEHLAGFQPRGLPKAAAVADTETPAAPDGSYATWSGQIDLPLSRISETSREVGVSLLALCQAAWASTLGALLGTHDVCFGNVMSGRTVSVERITELVAPCFNTVPVRVDLREMGRSVDLLKRFQELNPSLLEHQFTSLRSIMRSHASRQGADSGSHRLFDSILLLQQPPTPLSQDIWILERDDGEMDVPLVCELSPNSIRDTLCVKLHYERSSVSDAAILLVSDLLSHSVSSCLNFPASHVPIPPNLPDSLRARISGLDLVHPTPSSPGPGTEGLHVDDSWDKYQSKIRSVFSKLSSVPEKSIRRSTTIYQLGLDSISAVQIASLLRQEGFGVTATDVIDHNTCEALALRLGPTTNGTTTPPSHRPAHDNISVFREQVYPLFAGLGIVSNTVEGVLPCTSLQSGILSQFMCSTGHDYFNFIDFRLENSGVVVDADRLHDAWATIVKQHPILRTGFVTTHDKTWPFAMVQYEYPSDLGTVSLADDAGGGFNTAKWRLDSAASCKQQLHLPPWRAVCASREEGLVTIHLAILHALYDAQSLYRILDDLACAFRGTPLPAVSPMDTAVLGILEQTTSNLGRHEAFWRRQADELVVNQFPILTPLREESRTILVETATSTRPSSRIELALRESGFSMQAAIQAAWTRVLSSYVGESTVTFGVVLSGRNSEAIGDAVFPCITTLPAIARNRPSNRELLQHMQSSSSDLYKQQHVPLVQIQRWLGRPNSRLFDTLLVYQKLAGGSGDSRCRSLWEVVDDRATIDYPVSVEVEPRDDDKLEYRVTFFSDVLPRQQASLLLRQFDAILFSLATRPDGAEGDLFSDDSIPKHADTDTPQILSILPAREPTIPSRERFLHEFVEFQARQIPDEVALRFVHGWSDDTSPISRTWSYRELDENGNRVARMLLNTWRVKTGDRVAVCFDTCPEAFFAILGILKAGCAFVALDPNAPAARKEFILEDSHASVLLMSASGGRNRDADKDWPRSDIPRLEIDEETLCAQQSDGDPVQQQQQKQRPLVPDDGCYCLYTSGTTGTPKGCEITHENAVQAMLAFQRLFAGRWEAGSSRWLQFASFHFDVAVLEQYWSWSVGITLVAAPRDLILEDLAGTISKLGITHIDLTPSLARLIRPDEVPSLCRGVFITGGEQLRREILDVWGTEGAIFNAYGPTEATIGVTTFPRVPRNGRSSNIGRQFDNVGAYVLKPGSDEPVLRGAVGELCLSGKLVGKGYLNRADLTADKFPTLSRLGERVYRTGDLVRVLHDGCFDFLGRADDQVKLRGQRLEIGEINHTIRKSLADEISDVATLVVRNEKQQKDLLVSFVVISPGDKEKTRRGAVPLQAITGSEATALARRVQDSCRQALPGYMVPTYVLQLPYIPLSPNNKAEVKELRKLFNALDSTQLLSSSGAAAQAAAATTTGNSNTIQRGLSPTEEKIVDVLASAGDAMDRSHISPSTTIFELGIDSISVIRFSALLRRAGFDLASPALILKNPRLRDLSDALAARPVASAAAALSSVSAARQRVQAAGHRYRLHVMKELGVGSDDIEYIAPCSPLQEGMISRRATPREETGRTEARRAAYLNTFRYELPSTASVVRLRAAWQAAFDAYPILRTVFIATTDGPVQVALKSLPLPWAEREVGGGDEMDTFLVDHQKSWIDAANKENICRPLDLVVVRAREARRSVLAVQIFHGLYDAISLNIVLGRVVYEYHHQAERAIAGGAAHDINGPSFLDGLIHGPLRDLGWCKKFWVDHFRGLSRDNIKAFPRLCGHPSGEPISCQRDISFEPLDRVRLGLGVTHQSVVQAAWASVMRETIVSRSDDDANGTTIGVVTSGRSTDLDGSDLIAGPLFNTIPFQISTTREDTWSSLIRRCHDFNVAVLPFQHVPLKDVQKWISSSHPSASPAGKPLFDTLFSFQRETTLPSRTDQIWTELESTTLDPDFPLAFEASLTESGGLKMLIVAQGGYADAESLSGLLDRVEEAVLRMSEDSDGQISITSQNGTAYRATTPHPNGLGEGGPGSKHDAETDDALLDWTPSASIIREHVAHLAQVSQEDIAPTTSLLELGLDSIDAIKLSSRLRKAGLDISTSQLIGARTIAALARQFERHDSRVNGHPGPHDADGHPDAPTTPSIFSSTTVALKTYLDRNGIDLEGVETVLPTTPLQDSMVADMIQSSFRHYFNHDILELAPEVDIIRLKNAWETVFSCSPILRTSFVPVDSPDIDSAYCQVVVDKTTTPLVIRETQFENMSGLALITEEARLRAEAAGGVSDLFQLALVTVSNYRRQYLVLSIAHALYDGWSLGLVHHDVRSAYEGSYSARDSYEPYLGQMVASSQSPVARHFWSGFLDGATPTLIPEIQVPPSSHNSIDDSKSPVIRAEAASLVSPSNVKLSSRKLAVSPHVLGQACWAALVAARTRSLDVTFGVVLSGRDSELSESLMFPAMNTVAVRSVLHGTVRSWLHYMQENMASISRFQHFPLRKAQGLFTRGQKLSTTQLFNSLFLYQRRPDVRGEGGGDNLPMSPVDLDEAAAAATEYPVSVEMEMMPDDKLVWRVAGSPDYVTVQDAAVVLHQLDVILRFLIDSPTADVLSFGSDGEISICGLPPITPPHEPPRSRQVHERRDEVPSQASGTFTDATGDSNGGEDWPEPERRIRSVLAELSAIPDSSIRRSHSIYHLGLDSISSIKASSLLQKKEGIVLSPRQLLRAQSITDMARLAASSSLARTDNAITDHTTTNETARSHVGLLLRDVDPRAALEAAGLRHDSSLAIQETLPATPMQVHMLSVWQNTSGRIMYPTFHYRLSGGASLGDSTIRPESLASAWQVLVREMPILRTSFVATATRELPFLQLIHKSNIARIVIDGKGWFSHPEHKSPTSPPLVSLCALSRMEESGGAYWVLELSIHHALYDGVSLPLILRRFQELVYRCQRQPPVEAQSQVEDEGPEVDVSSSWKQLLALVTSPGEQEKRKTFWAEYLHGAKTTPFPSSSTASPAPLLPPPQPRTARVVRSAIGDVSSIQAACRQRGVSVQALFLAASARFLAAQRSSNSGSESRNRDDDDVVFGIYVANRHLAAGVDSLPYPTLSLVPLRVRVGQSADTDASADSYRSLGAMASKIQQDVDRITSESHELVGLWEVQAWTGITVDLFVNFLSLPAEGQEKSEGGAHEVILQEIDPMDVNQEAMGKAFNKEEEEYPVGPWMSSNPVRDSFLDAVDIEASIRGSAMDIGVFSPTALIGQEGAEKVVSELAGILGSII